MPDRPITRDDAVLYIEHVSDHGLHEDMAWLLDFGRFPVGCRVLDVGCGTGALVAELAAEAEFARSAIGVELSPELAEHARETVRDAGGRVMEGDFLSWRPPADWQPDTAVMSFYLHHCEDMSRHLRRAAALLPHGGRLYVLDRLAIEQSDLEAFPRFWSEHYRSAHEWSEDMPRLATVSDLVDVAKQAGFAFVRRQVCPHDARPGAEGFPKTIMEFWRQDEGRAFPAILVISPAHGSILDDVVRHLASAGLEISTHVPLAYTDDLVRKLYERCPWRERLARFVGEVCPDRIATALRIAGDDTTPALLNRLGQFKKAERGRWQSIEGPTSSDGFRALILPFHVPEPYEAELAASAIGLAAV